MEFTTVYTLFLLTVIAVAIVVLTILQGRTAAKIKKLGKEFKQLKKEVKQYHDEIIKDNQHTEQPVELPKPKPIAAKLQTVKKRIQSTDFEWFIGGSLYSTLGVALLSIGLALFVKYAFDQQWINDVGRVSVAVLVGGILFAIAQMVSSRYRMFGSVLVGGGISILFFAFALAYYQYKLFDLNIALMVFLFETSFAVFLAVSYNRQELAFLTTVSGFTAPLIAGVDFSNYIQLFSYILILDVALLIVSYYKKWLFIYITAFAFTVAFFGIWTVREFLPSIEPPFYGAFIFLTIFFFVFLMIGTINNISHKTPFRPFELSVIISLTVIYYSAGLIIITKTNDELKGLFTALIAIVNFAYLGILIRNKNIDKGLLYLLFGLGLVFTVLIPPVQLVGKTVTLVWSVQTVLLLWLSQKLDVTLMRLGAIALLAALIISLTLDMIKVYYAANELHEPLTMFFNVGFFTNIMASGAFISSFILLKQNPKNDFVPKVKVSFLQSLVGIVSVVSVYMTFYLEIKYHLLQTQYYIEVIDYMIGSYNLIFLSIPAIASVLFKNPKAKLFASIPLLLAIVLYIFNYHIDLLNVREIFVTTVQFNKSDYYFHFITSFVLLLAASAVSFNSIKTAQHYTFWSGALLWVSMSFVVFMLSSELDHFLLLKHYNESLQPSQFSANNYTMPYTLLWSIIGVFFMISAIAFHWKQLRFYTLSFMFFTLIKFFTFDLPKIEKQQQILLFTVLGISLLIIAFLDQKVKVKSSKIMK